MKLNLIPATKEQISVLQHLLQFYMYDFSTYTRHDVGDNGLFAPYPGLESYWGEGNNKFPYLIKRKDRFIGFALVQLTAEQDRSYFSMAEFFILRKYRLQGAGKSVATRLFTIHKGRWEVYQMNSNRPARRFWKKVIKKFTKGKFTKRSAAGKSIQIFES